MRVVYMHRLDLLPSLPISICCGIFSIISYIQGGGVGGKERDVVPHSFRVVIIIGFLHFPQSLLFMTALR